MQARTDPIPDHLKTGALVLIFTRWGWESLTQLHAEPAWRVAAYDSSLAWDWETESLVPGWRSETSNPYADYAHADPIAWAEIPELPTRGNHG